MASADTLTTRPGMADPAWGPPKPSGFNSRERWFLAVAFVSIAVWGFSGVDRTGFDEPIGPRGVEVQRRAPATGTGIAVDPVAERGQEVFQANGCYACHSIDGSAGIGPTLAGRWGRTETMVDGSSRLFDGEYFRESIVEPQAEIVRGFVEAAMPSYEGLIDDDDLAALGRYVQSLR